jgi:hypothetical protein
MLQEDIYALNHAFPLLADFLWALSACFSPRKNNIHDPVVCEVLIPREISFSKCVALVKICFALL